MAKKLYNPNASEPFKLSRSMVELFVNCPRCFYLDRRLGISRPSGYPFSLNSAVDALLKKEFDGYRERGEAHPLMREHNINAIPFKHERMDEWRDALRRGIQYLHKPTNLLITGGVDDIWVNPKGEIIIVDYKATAKNGDVSIDAQWQGGYRRQMDLYAWLFSKNGFDVAAEGYFVYCNGKLNADNFSAKLDFKISVLPYAINNSWVEPTLNDIKKCLSLEKPPAMGEECEYCEYVKALSKQ